MKNNQIINIEEYESHGVCVCVCECERVGTLNTLGYRITETVLR